MSEVMHQHLIEFITKHRDGPFYIYYSMSHIHAEILPTADSKDLYGDTSLYHMRERLRRIGGRLECHSRPGHGTRMVFRVPDEAAVVG